MIEGGDNVEDEECTVNSKTRNHLSSYSVPMLSDEGTAAANTMSGEMRIPALPFGKVSGSLK